MQALPSKYNNSSYDVEARIKFTWIAQPESKAKSSFEK